MCTRRCVGKLTDAGLEEQHNHQHAQTTPVGTRGTAGVDTNGSRDEDHDHGLENHEDETGLAAKVHESSSRKATCSKQTLSNGVEVGSLQMRLGDGQIRACLRKVVDKVRSDTDLGTDVGELRECTPEQSVLLAQRLVDVAGGASGHLSLVGHVGVGDLRDGSEVEDDGEDGDEASDTKVHPLHGLEGATVSANVLEDNLRSEDGRDD
jgi:hypothetical protein